jgi:hypothetical protein
MGLIAEEGYRNLLGGRKSNIVLTIGFSTIPTSLGVKR